MLCLQLYIHYMRMYVNVCVYVCVTRVSSISEGGNNDEIQKSRLRASVKHLELIL